ncbi:MAG: hypothetical protein AABY14_04050 [Nanoarchaeota archaeon]
MAKGNVVPILLIVVVVLTGVVGYLLYSRGFIKNPISKEEVRLNTQYTNPFEKESSYVNPFDEYKNPFDVIGAEGHE